MKQTDFRYHPNAADENSNDSDDNMFFPYDRRLMQLKKKMRIEGLKGDEYAQYVELLSESVANKMNEIMKSLNQKFNKAVPKDVHVSPAKKGTGISLAVSCTVKDCKALKKQMSQGFSQDYTPNLSNFKRHFIRYHVEMPGMIRPASKSLQSRHKKRKKSSDEDYNFSVSFVKEEVDLDNNGDVVNQVWLGGRHSTALENETSPSWQLNSTDNHRVSNHTEQMSKIDLALSKMLISASVPFEILDNRYFKDFVHELNSSYDLPKSRDLKEKLLEKLNGSSS